MEFGVFFLFSFFSINIQNLVLSSIVIGDLKRGWRSKRETFARLVELSLLCEHYKYNKTFICFA